KTGPLRFAYMKATQGANYTDKTFAGNWSRAREAGFVTGAYHVFSFCDSADQQFALLNRVIPKDAAALPIAIDIQWNQGSMLDQRCRDEKDEAAIKKNLRELVRLIS